MDGLGQATEAMQSAGVPAGFVAAIVGVGVLVVLIVMGLAWLGVIKKPKDKESASGEVSLRDYLESKFDSVGKQIGSVGHELSELTADFKTHAEQDRESFRELYSRTEAKWDGNSERRERPGDKQWKAAR